MKIEMTKYVSSLTWIIRIVVGGVFIFSGFAKGIDPYGTLYKVEDYLSVLSLSVWPNLVLVGVFGLCALEFLAGVFLLTGCFRRSSVIIAGGIMAFMLPLTLWIAVSNPVADCGCFGDAFLLSNWATFWKNVGLSVGLIWLWRYNRKIICLITPALQWICIVGSCIFIVTIELFGYMVQPLIDFRPYKIGERIVDSEESFEEGPQYLFVYEKDGIRKKFKETDSLPEENDGWIFVDREEILSEEGGKNDKGQDEGKSFRAWSKNGEDDETDEAVVADGNELIVMIPELGAVSPATTWKLNSLYEWSQQNDITMVGIVSGSSLEISTWEDLSMASYPIFTADDTHIKEVVRGNPGIVYLIDGVIQWKMTLNAINIDDFLSPDTSYEAENFSFDNKSILRNCVSVYLIFIGLLITLSLTPQLRNLYINKGRKKKCGSEQDGKGLINDSGD